VTAAPALAYPDVDLTTTDAECFATLEGLIDTTAGTWSGDLVMICDVHDDLVVGLMVLSGVMMFAMGFGIVTVVMK
jgi:hypothetical protein